MNVKVTYDEKTTALMEEWEYLRKKYIKKLNKFIKDRPYTSYSQSIELFDDDPGLKEIDRQISKLYKLSIPLYIEIINEDKHKFRCDK